MTQEQKSDYNNKYGCMSKALRKLAERRGKPISLKAYCERCEKFFHPKYYGALITSTLIEVGKELGLCSWAHTFVNLERAKRIVRESSGLFVITEKFWHGEARCFDGPHARLVLDYQNNKWVLWNEDHEGREERLTDDDLSRQMAHFIAFDLID